MLYHTLYANGLISINGHEIWFVASHQWIMLTLVLLDLHPKQNKLLHVC